MSIRYFVVLNQGEADDNDDDDDNNNNKSFGARLSPGVTSGYWDMLDKHTQLLVLSIVSR